MKLSEAFADFRRIEIRGRGCSPSTDEGYEYAMRVIIDYFGDVSVRKLGVDEVSDFYLSIIGLKGIHSGRIVSRNTAREYVAKLRAVLRFCRKRGVKTANPDEIIIPKPEKRSARFIGVEEYSRFLEEAGRSHHGYSNLNRERNVLIVKMLFHTGLRIGELCALDRDSIKDRQFVVVGKSKDPRPCFITKDIEAEISRYLAMRADNNPALFISNENGRRITPDTVQRVFRRIAAATGLTKVTPHTLRHSFATRLVDDGVDIRHISAFLGHQSLDTTKRYTHIRDYKLKEIYTQVMEKTA